MSEANGETVDLHPAPTVEYRLSWEHCEAQAADYYVSRHGPDVWSRMNDAQWGRLRWVKTSRTSSDLVDVADQRATLELWAQTHDQPIRNVKLERRSVHLSQWDPVDE